MKKESDMKNFTLLFLVLAIVTGLLGFADIMEIQRVVTMRVACLIFTDLFVVSLFAPSLLPKDHNLRYQKIQK